MRNIRNLFSIFYGPINIDQWVLIMLKNLFDKIKCIQSDRMEILIVVQVAQLSI